jgi:hypothetical protein
MRVSSERSTIAWNFGVQPENSRENEPTQEEFFSNESLITEVAAVVRESIQNSLDERLDKSKPIKVRFKLGEQSPELSKRYFGELINHADLVIPGGAPSINETQQFLVIEDFNTLGLEGSTSSAVPKLDPIKDKKAIDARGHKDSYWYFEWSTGKTNKSAGKRGSWGVGKIVFPRASALKSYLVLSERRKLAAPDEDECILFGHSILNYRTVGGVRYVPDCQWMTIDNKNNLFVPSANQAEIDAFRSDWSLQRKIGELGTSIVVPFVNQGMSGSQLIHSIVRDYFVTVLGGMLICEVEDSKGNLSTLDRDSISSLITEWDDSQANDLRSNREMLELCDLYKLSQNKETIKFNFLNPNEKANDWNSFHLDEEQTATLSDAFESEKPIEINVNTLVPSNRDGEQQRLDEFTILIKKVDEIQGKTVFCREGILIPGAYPTETKGYVSMVLVGEVGDDSEESNSLASLLKRAEGPSHEKWTVTASHFKGHYRPEELGNRTVAWVKKSVQAVFQIIRRQDLEPDIKSLAKFFPKADDGSSSIPNQNPGPGPKEVLKRAVRLSANKAPGNPRHVQLSWNNVNVSQDAFSLWIIEPVEREISNGGSSVFSENTTVDDDWKLIIFQVHVKDQEQIYKSNRITLNYEEVGSNPQLFAEQSGSGIVVKAMDPSAMSKNMTFSLEFGYRVRRGSTFGADSEFDLDLLKAFKPDLSSGLRVEKTSKVNAVTLVVESPDFYAHFAGFNHLLDPALKFGFIGASI